MAGARSESMLDVESALQRIIDNTIALPSVAVAVRDALGAYLAEDIFAPIDLPLFSQSAVDGYALCAADTTLMAGMTFSLVGEIRAGQSHAMALANGQALRIFTGSPIPEGTVTVARQEIVEKIDAENIRLLDNLARDCDIRHAGEEITQGRRIAQRGQHLTVGAIAALSMAGVTKVNIYRRPRIAAVITGDEIASTADALPPGQVLDANTPLITAWLKEKHLSVDMFYAIDSADAVSQLLQQLQNHYDVIISTGGVSVGDYDFIRPISAAVGFEHIFWKVKQKPGKPLLFGRHQRADNTCCYLLGLPGNPAAVYVGLHIYATTLLACLQGKAQYPAYFSAVLAEGMKTDTRARFLRMQGVFEQGVLTVRTLPKQQSHMLSNLMQANCLIMIPHDVLPQAGDIVQGIFIE